MVFHTTEQGCPILDPTLSFLSHFIISIVDGFKFMKLHWVTFELNPEGIYYNKAAMLKIEKKHKPIKVITNISAIILDLNDCGCT